MNKNGAGDGLGLILCVPELGPVLKLHAREMANSKV